MTGPLKNARQERFAQELAKGRSQDAAYAKAGYSPSATAASRLCRNVQIAARLAELKERAAARAVVTVYDIANQLQQDRLFARKHKQGAAAVSATMGRAKVLGLVVERHAGPDGGPIRFRYDLSNLTDEEIDALERIHAKLAPAGGDPRGEGQASS